MPLHWALEAFALAVGYDETAGRYVGLWLPDARTPAPGVTDSLLVVRPEIATKQVDDERVPEPAPGPGPTPVVPVPVPPGPSPVEDHLRRFYGVKTLDPDRIALDFKNIADEVLSHLRDSPSTTVTVRIEIEATDADGFDEGKVRTVGENARTLKFEQSGFEEA